MDKKLKLLNTLWRRFVTQNLLNVWSERSQFQYTLVYQTNIEIQLNFNSMALQVRASCYNFYLFLLTSVDFRLQCFCSGIGTKIIVHSTLMLTLYSIQILATVLRTRKWVQAHIVCLEGEGFSKVKQFTSSRVANEGTIQQNNKYSSQESNMG